MILIERGYNRRHRHEWAIARWQTYNIMTAQVGGEAMKKAGIRNPIDLITFPWEKAPVERISDTDKQELLDLMASINAKNSANEPTPESTEP